jgi:hypothetical protein
MPWHDSALPDAWFNPWPIRYLLPNAEWETVPFKGPPDRAIVPWWKLPKSSWPIEAPWESKVLGCWPASQVTMSEDLPPSIWPGGHRAPPFGFIKLKMPGEPDTSGDQTPFVKMRVHMRPEIFYVAHHMKITSHNTPMGQKFYVQDEPWEQYGREYRKYKAKLQRQFK